jgi:RNA-directed DNA polymerase
LSSPTVSTKLAWIAEQSKRNANMVFTTLAHLTDEDFLTEACYQLRKDAAAGIDQMTVADYEPNLGENIARLHQKLVTRQYRAQPARRVWISVSICVHSPRCRTLAAGPWLTLLPLVF